MADSTKPKIDKKLGGPSIIIPDEIIAEADRAANPPYVPPVESEAEPTAVLTTPLEVTQPDLTAGPAKSKSKVATT